MIQVVDVQDIHVFDTGVAQLLEQFLGQFRIRIHQDFAGFLVHNGIRRDLTQQVLIRHFKGLDTCVFNHLDVACCDSLAVRNQNFSGSAADIKNRRFTAQAFRHQFQLGAGLFQRYFAGVEESIEDFFVIHAQGAQ